MAYEGQGEDAPLPEQPPPGRGIELHPPEVAAVHVRNPVVPGEPLVHERVRRGQQVEDAAVAAQHAVDEQLGLAPERPPQVLVETGEEPRVGLLRIDVAKEQPLLGEVVHEGGRPRIREHPAHLAVEHPGLAQPAPNRGVEQFFVGNAAPQEERQARRQLEIADRIHVAGRRAGRIALDPETGTRD